MKPHKDWCVYENFDDCRPPSGPLIAVVSSLCFHVGSPIFDFGLLGLVGELQPKFKSPTGDPKTQKGSSGDGPTAHANDGRDSRGRAPSIFTPLETACPSGRTRPRGQDHLWHRFQPFNLVSSRDITFCNVFFFCFKLPLRMFPMDI